MLLLSLVACQDYAIHNSNQKTPVGAPMVEVDPLQLDFGAVPLGTTATKFFRVKSVGDVPLTLESVELKGDGTFSLLNDVHDLEIAVGSNKKIEVVYTPASDTDKGSAVVKTDDEGDPKILVDLLGGGGYPDLEVSPPKLDFGSVNPGDTKTIYMDLENVGDATLTINSATSPSTPFSATYPFPIDIAPGDKEQVEVTFQPSANGTFKDSITVSSNDPDGDTTVQLEGTADAVPYAVCSASPNPVAAIYDSTTFFGAGSYDPNGYNIVAYKWSLLSQPTGSAVTMPGGITDANRKGFVADLVGDYVAQLIVTNSVGKDSEPCLVTLTAEASADLWVEMHWQYSGDDMDLHLLAPSGTLLSTDDCYYQNCTGGRLDWGVHGVTTDNPRLDLDDIPGTGPENINIEAPVNGVYTVYVNDYPMTVREGPNDVTVTIYASGVKVWSDTRTLTTENEFMPFAEVEWPSGIVTPL